MIFTGSHDGYVTNWSSESGENDRVQGAGHGNQINGMKAFNGTLYTIGIDDSLKQIDIEGRKIIIYSKKPLKVEAN